MPSGDRPLSDVVQRSLRVKRACKTVLSILIFALASPLARGQGTELNFADFNNQGPFNNFSGDNGTFASGRAAIDATFDNRVFHGSNGASLRIDYAVPEGFCGVWHSLMGKASFPQYTLNFTNLYGPLLNSRGNPSRVENVKVTQFSFWARGDGNGQFEHRIKVEFKSPEKVLGNAVFGVPNRTNWVRCDFQMSGLDPADLSRMKEVVFVLEDWKNDNRTGRFYLDDLSFTTDELACDPAHWSNDAMLDMVAQRAFRYFLVFTDGFGFALDRSTYSDMVSVGTIGFQLTAYCIGHQRGWADRSDLEQRVVTILRNLRDLPMGPETGISRAGYRGFYYHFLTANTGRRKDGNVELSLYDTMLLMYGVQSCREYFSTNAQIQTLSRQLFDRVQWDWFVDHSPGVNSNRFHLAWQPGPKPEGTFLKHVDGQTDEAFMVDVLAMGSKAHPTSLDNYNARNRVCGSYPADSEASIMASWKGALFNYFFASCWLNFQDRGLDLHPNGPRDLWQNDKLAILANRRFCIDHAARRAAGPKEGCYSTYGPAAWGLTACDNLVAPVSGWSSEYFPFGALPSEENIRFGTKASQAGTIAVYGAVSSINFAPDAALAALRHYFEIPGLWSPLFGFGDAFSLDPHYLSEPYDSHGNPSIRVADFLNGPWINPMVMGINVGPMLLAIENYRSQFVWKLTAKSPELAAGLDAIFGVCSARDITIAVGDRANPRGVNLHWRPEPGITEYNIYTSTDMENWSLRKNGVHGTEWTDDTLGATAQCFYWVKGVR